MATPTKNPQKAALNTAIGKRIAERRRIRGLTQKQLAALVGVGEKSLQAWEGGRANPYRRLPLLARILGCSPEWLYTGTNT